jgi:hypothetical protein
LIFTGVVTAEEISHSIMVLNTLAWARHMTSATSPIMPSLGTIDFYGFLFCEESEIVEGSF